MESESSVVGWIVDGYLHAEVTPSRVEVRRYADGHETVAHYVRDVSTVHCHECRHFAKYGDFECCEVRPAAGRFKVDRDGFCNLAERRDDG